MCLGRKCGRVAIGYFYQNIINWTPVLAKNENLFVRVAVMLVRRMGFYWKQRRFVKGKNDPKRDEESFEIIRLL